MLIAHDLGTSGDKASLHALDGTMIASTTVPYTTVYGTGGGCDAHENMSASVKAACSVTPVSRNRFSTA